MASEAQSLRDLLRGDAPGEIGARPLRSSPLPGILIGLLLVAVAMVVKLAIARLTDSDVAYLPLFLVLPVGVIVGGIWAGVTITIAGVVVDALLFEELRAPRGILAPSELARLLLFVPVSLWITLLIASLSHLRLEARREADRLAAIVRALPGFAILVDGESGQIRYVSDAIGRLGWAPGDLVGEPAEKLLPDLDRAAPDEVPVTTGLLTPTGDELSVEVVRVPVPQGSGTAALYAARDLSAQAEHEFQLLRLAADERRAAQSLQEVVASMDTGVALIAPDDTVTLANDALTTMAGGPVPTRRALEAGLGVALEEGEVHVPESGRWLRMTLHRIEGDELVLVRDMTPERQAAAAQEAFMGILSHELRTPVTTILGLAHLVGRRTLDTAQTADLADDIVAEADRLGALIEDLLVLSRSQRGRVTFDPEPVLVQHAIGAVIEAEAARHPHITFATEMDRDLPPAEGDRTLLTQVLRNIIGNAAKYSPATPCTVTVTARALGDEVEVVVRDEGPGFDPGDEGRLFDIFFRSSRTARARAGSGIGLYVARTLVEAMSGRIWAHLRPEGGSEFGFALPVLAVDEVTD